MTHFRDQNKTTLAVVTHNKETYLQQLDVLNLSDGVWKSVETKGTPHPGMVGAAHVVQRRNQQLKFGQAAGAVNGSHALRAQRANFRGHAHFRVKSQTTCPS